MELVARESGYAKATVYAYFKNKDALFRAVAEDVAQRIVGAVETALLGGGTPAARVGAALQAKEDLAFDLIHRSPHAAELFAAKHQLSGKLFEDVEARIMAALAAAIGGSHGDAKARVLFHAAHGLASAAQSKRQLLDDLTILADGILRP